MKAEVDTDSTMKPRVFLVQVLPRRLFVRDETCVAHVDQDVLNSPKLSIMIADSSVERDPAVFRASPLCVPSSPLRAPPSSLRRGDRNLTTQMWKVELRGSKVREHPTWVRSACTGSSLISRLASRSGSAAWKFVRSPCRDAIRSEPHSWPCNVT